MEPSPQDGLATDRVLKKVLRSYLIRCHRAVARDIARAIGASRAGEGYLHGNGWVVTWALGHLVRLPEPHEIDPQWRQWQRQQLPMLPREWPLVVEDDTRQQFEIVQQILTSPKVDRVVCATDAGRL